MLVGWGDEARARIRGAAQEPPWERAQLTVSGTLTHHPIPGGGELWLTGRVHGTRDPTRTLANAIAMSGLNRALRELHGAYVVVVRLHDRVVVAHDQLGARPVVYVGIPGGALVAEQVVDVLDLLPTTPVPDLTAIAGWLDRRRAPADRTLYHGIRRLLSGRFLELGEYGARTAEQWHPDPRQAGSIGVDDAHEALRAAVHAAVARSVEGARTPAVKLSGGLDSGVIASGIAQATAPVQALAFAGVFPAHPEVDEEPLIEATARTSGLQLVRIAYRPSRALPSTLAALLRWRIPPVTTNRFVWHELDAAVRRHDVDVLLDGEGGDELFGLSPQLLADRLRRGRLASAWALSARLPGFPPGRQLRLRRVVLRTYGVGGVVPLRVLEWRRARRGSSAPANPLLSNAATALLYETDRSPWDARRHGGPRWWSAAVDRALVARAQLDADGELHRLAVEAGVECRHPFMHDVELLETVLQLPPQLAFDARRDRPVLRDAMVGHLAPSVYGRHAKSRFNALLHPTVEGPDGRALARLLRSPSAPVRQYVEADRLESLVAGPRLGDADAKLRWPYDFLTVALLDCWLRMISGNTDVLRRLYDESPVVAD